MSVWPISLQAICELLCILSADMTKTLARLAHRLFTLALLPLRRKKGGTLLKSPNISGPCLLVLSCTSTPPSLLAASKLERKCGMYLKQSTRGDCGSSVDLCLFCCVISTKSRSAHSPKTKLHFFKASRCPLQTCIVKKQTDARQNSVTTLERKPQVLHSEGEGFS